MSQEIEQNRIYELVELLGKKEIEPYEIKERLTELLSRAGKCRNNDMV